MSESVGPSQIYHQSNLTMPDMGLAMKPEASPPTPRSLRFMPNTSVPIYGQSTEELRRLNLQASGANYMSHENIQTQQFHQRAQERAALGGLPGGTTHAAAMAAAAKKKSIKSSLGRLFSKKEKVSSLIIPHVDSTVLDIPMFGFRRKGRTL